MTAFSWSTEAAAAPDAAGPLGMQARNVPGWGCRSVQLVRHRRCELADGELLCRAFSMKSLSEVDFPAITYEYESRRMGAVSAAVADQAARRRRAGGVTSARAGRGRRAAGGGRSRPVTAAELALLDASECSAGRPAMGGAEAKTGLRLAIRESNNSCPLEWPTPAELRHEQGGRWAAGCGV